MRLLRATAVFGLVLSGTIARTQDAGQPVNVWVEGADVVPRSMDRAARDTVISIFARIGVRIEWLDGNLAQSGAHAGPVVIHVRFVSQPMGKAGSGPFAYAFPFDHGVKAVTIQCDRIHLAAGGWSREQHLLAHVLAHEIGHILQCSDGHSRTGVMKAHWDIHDYDEMQRKPLEFTPGDVDLIRQGLRHLEAGARNQRR